MEYPSRKNVLHCLEYFASQSFHKDLFPIFSKNSKINKRGGRRGGLNKNGAGGQGKNKRGDVYLGRCSTWSVENQIETRLKALKQWHVSHCGAWSLRFYTNSFKKAT